MDCKFYDISCIAHWSVDEIKALFLNFFHSILGAFASVFESIPIPDFLLNVGSFSLPVSVLFWTDLFQVPLGLSIIVPTYILRFIIRRLPVVG